MTLGQKIRELRVKMLWAQKEAAIKVGVSRATISAWERDRAIPSANAFLNLARAFNIRPEELYQASGYIKDVIDYMRRDETSEEILDRLRLAHPVSVPVYTDFPFHAGGLMEPVEYVYRERTKAANKNIEGYIVHGKCLEPIIRDQDIIILDREGAIDTGDIVAALVDGKLAIGKLRKIADELWLENNDGRIRVENQIAAPVIEVIRRLK